MLHADLRKPEMEWRRKVGHVMEQARDGMGWTLEELAGKFDPAKDPRQLARWEKGDERLQFDLLLAIEAPRFRRLLVLGFARLGGEGVVIETRILINED